MWAPLPPDPPARGWWHDLETAEQFETRRWVEGIASDLRAERIERLKALAHEVNMRCAGALSADRWERIQRRRELQGAVPYKGMMVNSWGIRPAPDRGVEARWAGPIEHSGHRGSILSVR